MALLEWEAPRGLKSKKLPNEPKHPSPDVSWTWGDRGVACKRLLLLLLLLLLLTILSFAFFWVQIIVHLLWSPRIYFIDISVDIRYPLPLWAQDLSWLFFFGGGGAMDSDSFPRRYTIYTCASDFWMRNLEKKRCKLPLFFRYTDKINEILHRDARGMSRHYQQLAFFCHFAPWPFKWKVLLEMTCQFHIVKFNLATTIKLHDML